MSEHRPPGWATVAEHIKATDVPQPLSELQLARLAKRVFDSPAVPRYRWKWVFVALIPLTAVLAIWVARVPRVASLPKVEAPLSVPPAAEPARMAVLGSGIAVPVAEGRIVVRDGHVAIRTSDNPLAIVVPDGHVEISRHALVEVEVHQMRTRVAAYRGQATLSTAVFTITIPAGRETSASGVVMSTGNQVAALDAALDATATPSAAHPPSVRVKSMDPLRPKAIPTEPAPIPPPVVVVEATPPGLGEESELAATMLKRVREHDPAGALVLAAEHATRFPSGALASEVSLASAEALAQLGRPTEALAALDRAAKLGAGPSSASALLRGELHAAAGDCGSALSIFDAAVGNTDRALASRARFDRGVCRARLGNREGARSDLKAYLESNPKGPNAETARRALEN